MSTFNSFTNSFNKRLQELSTTVSQKTQEFSTNMPDINSLAQSTQRMVQERLGQVTDISQLPEEYLQLERKIDTIKSVYDNFLSVTNTFEHQSYDYPNVARESVIEFSKSAVSKVEELSHATSASEAQQILTNNSNQIKEPKTLNYALSKASLISSEQLNKQFSTDDDNNSNSDFKLVSSILLKFSDIQAKIAQARLQQDLLIKQKFNNNLRNDLNTSFERAQKVRKDVQNKRLQYDVARTNLLNAKPEKEASLRVQMELLEDQFAQATEHATLVMNEIIENSNFMEYLNELARAQLAYYQLSSNIMNDFVKNIGNNSGIPTSTTTATTTTATSNDDTATQSTTKMDASNTPINLDDNLDDEDDE
ncbi:Gvp36p NDAI_0A02660 [Naumovozyma dairenensis CBS 421]|uniref:BAR domain-containing protein n=1 Tax=Naumovozyma dairenensis (strain ATCC 10597 / BCRC 20456 / CBS 421 / NBRC 0211 / NRRL Y-12639) TaxID=1071378 RepID=G0W3N6_NAUDC|nr:hypothetical protein NDAI_0A02660 [Naumovozyma dairenensis CBS 421]CCD22424.1 hypothetical protein NDAI_0A02660 [Naumovozyma dairenensis CBS 421]